MKVFIDANIFVSVINKEYPQYTYASRVLSWVTANKHQLVTTSVILAISFYFAQKKHGAAAAKQRIALLTDNVTIADCGKTEALQAATEKKIKDFEDGLQYFAALNAKCNCIVTENTKDFYFSAIDVLNAKNFLLKFYKTA